MDQPKIDVAALARLARIDVNPDMAARLNEQLPRIIDYVGQLQAVTTDIVAIEPTVTPLREDSVTVQPTEQRQRILQQAPDEKHDFWKVKAVF